MRRREVGGARWRLAAVGDWRGEVANTRSGGGYQPNPGPTDTTNAPPTWRLPDPEAITCRMWGLKRLLTTANSSHSGNRHPLRREGDVGGPTPRQTPAKWQFCAILGPKSAQNCHLAGMGRTKLPPRASRPTPPPSPSPTAPCMTSGRERGPVRNSIGEASIRKDNRS